MLRWAVVSHVSFKLVPVDWQVILITENFMEIEKADYERIALQIHSDDSPVGIDAKKTHILILAMLEKMSRRMERIEKKLDERKSVQELKI